MWSGLVQNNGEREQLEEVFAVVFNSVTIDVLLMWYLETEELSTMVSHYGEFKDSYYRTWRIWNVQHWNINNKQNYVRVNYILSLPHRKGDSMG